MAIKLSISTGATGSGSTKWYALYFQRSTGKVADTTNSTWDTIVAGDLADYSSFLSEVSTSGVYEATVPAFVETAALTEPIDYVILATAAGTEAWTDGAVGKVRYEGTIGAENANLTAMVSVAQSATDLKDFADDGYDPSTNKVQGVVLVDTTTTTTTATNVTTVNGLAANVITATSIASDAITAAKIANGAIDAATFAADVDAEILSYIVDDATRIDASALNTASGAIGSNGSGLTEAGGTGDQFTAIPWNASWDAEVQSEVDDALIAKGLDHLVFTSVTGTDIADNSIIAQLVSKSATADWDTYVNTTDSLEANRDNIGTTGAAMTIAAVTGSVGSVASGGITSSSFGSGAITSTVLAADCIGASQIATDAIGSAELAASAVTEIQSGLATATNVSTTETNILAKLPSALVGGRIDASVGAMAANTLTASALATDAVTEIAAGISIPSAATVADAVWDETRSGHVAAGSFGEGVLVQDINAGGISSSAFASGAITSSAIAADAIGASELAADAVAEIQSGLSTLTQANIRTAVGLASANLDTQLSDLPTVAEFEARTLVAANYFDPTADTVIVGTNNDKTGYALSSSGLDAVLVEASISAGAGLTNDTGIQLTSINARQALALCAAALEGVLAGAAGTTITIKPAAKPSGNTRITATVDSDGNRTALTLKVPD